MPNLLLELKTKTDHVDHLPRLGKNGNIVIGFSLNPQEIIDSEEPCAASLERRLEAAGRAAERGYRIAFHFDPVIAEEGWEDRYLPVARSLSRFRGCRTAWISMGTIRFPAPLRDALETRPYLCDEFIPCADGKFRYVQVRRIAVYRRLLAELRAALDTPVYLCMESDEVWRRVFGSTPRRMEKLRELFTPVRISPAR